MKRSRCSSAPLNSTLTTPMPSIIWASCHMGRLTDAIATFRDGLQVAPDKHDLYLNLARLYVRMGDKDQARKVMRSLLAREPDNEAAKRALRDLDAN